jgi:putative membrane protein
MKKVFLGSSIVAAALATGVVAQQSSQQQGSQSGQSSGQSAQSGGSSSQSQSGQSGSQSQQGGQQAQQQQQMDQLFIQHEASGNLFEQQLSQQVMQQAQDPKIKALAQQIIQDHKKAQEQLQQAAQKAGTQVPQEMNEVHKAILQMMQKKQGRNLELSYLWHQIGDHTKKVLEHRYMADNAQSPELKQYAQQTGQHLQHHLAQALSAAGLDAQAVTAEIGGSKQQGSKGTTFPPSSGQGSQSGQSGSQSGSSGGQSGSSSGSSGGSSGSSTESSGGSSSGGSSGSSSGGSSTGGSSSTPRQLNE